MEAGRELDREIANKIFGADFHWVEYADADVWWVPYFSTHVADAMEILDKLQESGWWWALERGVLSDGSTNGVTCKLAHISNTLRISSTNRTKAMAICMAALATLEE